ncbi:hypothetical protein L9F63_000736, partial [Diploptera punctata]
VTRLKIGSSVLINICNAFEVTYHVYNTRKLFDKIRLEFSSLATLVLKLFPSARAKLTWW